MVKEKLKGVVVTVCRHSFVEFTVHYTVLLTELLHFGYYTDILLILLFLQLYDSIYLHFVKIHT